MSKRLSCKNTETVDPLTLQQGYRFNQNQKKLFRDLNKKTLPCDRRDYREIKYPNVGVGVLEKTNYYDLINQPTTFKENFQDMNTTTVDSSILKKELPTMSDVVQSNFSELSSLDTQFNSVLEQYKTARSLYTQRLNSYIKDANEKSVYKNKNISVGDGKQYYINSQNIAKLYPSNSIYSSTQNKAGCPAGITNIGSKDLPGNITIGTNMIPGQSCGNEGINVYVDTLIRNPKTEYIGCYKDSSSAPTMTALSNGNEIYNYDSCLKLASDNSSPYFSLQNMDIVTGFGSCNIGSDINSIKQYGIAYDLLTEQIWSSGTTDSGPNIATLTNQGNIIIQNTTNQNVVWKSNEALSNCINGGMIKPNSLQGSYGMNCNSRGYRVTADNATSALNKNFGDTPKSNWSFGINNGNYGDPAGGCGKDFKGSYTCGDNTVKTVSGWEGGTSVFDCTNEVNLCTFFMLLGDDGNLSIYQGLPSTNAINSIWSTNTNTPNTRPNPDWVSTNGKYGVNYLKTGQSLASGEFIGSSAGNAKLMMENDGSLRIYISYFSDEPNCLKTDDGKFAGREDSNAVYSISTDGISANLGRVGYVNKNSQIQEYPESMTSLDTKYSVVNGYDSLDYTITNGTYTNTTARECIKLCNDDDTCVGFVFDESSKVGELKSTIFPIADREPNYNKKIYIRKVKVNNSDSCSKEIRNIDSILWENYPKNEDMTSLTTCGISDELLEEQQAVSSLEDQLSDISSQIVEIVKDMESMNLDINEKIGENNKSLDDYKEKYYSESQNIKRDIKVGQANRNAILEDKNMYVLEQNYKYILWSSLAIVIIIITMSVIKSR